MEAALDDEESHLARQEMVLPNATVDASKMERRLRDRWGREYTYHYGEDARRLGVVGFGGLFEGLVGFGIGVMGVADLILRGIPVRVAIGTSHAIIAVTAIAAAVPHVYEVTAGGKPLPWNIIAMTVPAVTIMAQASSYVAGYLPQELMKKLIAALLVILGLFTIGRSIYLFL